MRSLPQEELSPAKSASKHRHSKSSSNSHLKNQRKPEVAVLIGKIERYALDHNPSAARTSKLIQETRLEILQLHLSQTKKAKNRHSAPPTKKRPNKYKSH